MKKFLLAAALIFAACSQNQIDLIDGKVSITRPVKSWLKVEKSTFVRDKNNLGNASFIFSNKSSKNQAFFYNVIWLDDKGVAINSTLNDRKILRFVAHELKNLSVPAPNEAASSFMIKIYEITE